MPKFAANLTLMFTEVDFLDRFEAAAKAGFKAVEFHFPYAYGKEQIAERVAAHRLRQVLFNLPAGDWQAGDRGIACRPDRAQEFQDGVETAIDYATALGCKQVNCLAGIRPEGVAEESVRETLVANLNFAAAKLGEGGIRLLVEPINTRDIPGFYLCHTDQALAVIDEVGSANLALQYDVYHMQVMEGDLATTLGRNLDRIKHIQIADNPGRHEPGTGEIDYRFLLAFLDRLGYGGWVGCEYLPMTTTEEGLGWIKPYLAAAAA